jgi:hypothetical protein
MLAGVRPITAGSALIGRGFLTVTSTAEPPPRVKIANPAASDRRVRLHRQYSCEPAIEVIGRECRKLGKWRRENRFQAYEGRLGGFPAHLGGSPVKEKDRIPLKDCAIA